MFGIQMVGIANSIAKLTTLSILDSQTIRQLHQVILMSKRAPKTILKAPPMSIYASHYEYCPFTLKKTRLDEHQGVTLVSRHCKSTRYRINGVTIAVSHRLCLTGEVVDNIGGRAIIIESQRCRVVGC